MARDAHLPTGKGLLAIAPWLLAVAMGIGDASAAVVAGRTPATFSVGATGGATYSIPIWAPQGVGDVQLDLSLVYSSRTGNGVVGVGWALSGLSLITRCSHTVAQDGFALGVLMAATDRFCLDGKQLKLVTGTYGSPGSVYATEVESFSKIEAIGASGVGPSSFKVTTKNGLIYEYGLSADARLQPGGGATVQTWALSRISDRCIAPACAGSVGNRIDISYTNDTVNNTLRVASIAYPTTASNQGPFYEVVFAYEARPATDVPSFASAGFNSREPNRLKTITIRNYGSTTPTKYYSLVYAQSSVTNRSRLASIQECSATNCLPVTSIGYQNGVSGWSTTLTTTGVTTDQGGVLPIDLNADGLTDLLYGKKVTSTTTRWWALIATNGGFGTPIDTNVVTTEGDIKLSGTFSGNGQQQLLMKIGGGWTILQYNSSGSFSTASSGVTAAGEFLAIDYDGDGLQDLASVVGNEIRIRRNITAPPGPVTFASTAETVTTFVAGSQWSIWSGSGSTVKNADFNGDGRGDLQFISTKTNGHGDTEINLHVVRSNGFGVPATQIVSGLTQGPAVGIDWNGDGCTDIALPGGVSISACGDGPGGGSVTFPAASPTRMFADWDGDGRADLLYVNTSNNTWYVARSTGDGIAAAVSTGTAAPVNTSWFVFDRDGDGLTDLGYRDSGTNAAIKYRLHNGAVTPPDLATSFTDGYSINQSVSYATISRSNYSKYTTASFPEQDYEGPLYVAGTVTQSDGTGSTYQQTLQYYGARVHAQGRGFEGFYSRRFLDSRNNLYSYDYFGQTFPHTGMQTGETLSQTSGEILKWTSVSNSQISGGTGFERRYFPFLSTITQKQFQLGGPNSGALILQRDVAYTYGDPYGNVTQVVTSTTDKDSGSPFYNTTWQTTVDTLFQNSTSSNCLGLPLAIDITNEAPGQITETRQLEFANNTTLCRPRQQTVEPNNPALKVITTLTFDPSCANVNTVQVKGSKSDGTAMTTRTSQFDFGARCQLPLSIKNPLLHETVFTYHDDFATVHTMNDPNGIPTVWEIDDFGRRVEEDRADGTATKWTYTRCATPPCWGAADHRLMVTEDYRDTSDISFNTRQLIYDGMDRLRSDRTNRVLGVLTTTDFTYDSFGRLNTRSQPYTSVANENGYFDWDYDEIGRVTAAKLFRSAGNVHRSTTFGYDGRDTTATDNLSRTTTYTHDVLGFLRWVTDPSPGGITKYEYDAFGNLNKITDPGLKVSTAKYNLRGFNTRWVDADRGTWNFVANSLNEIESWTNANLQAFSAKFDDLGRMTERNDNGQVSQFVFGNSAAEFNIGKVKSKTGGGYTEELFYDALGRLSNRRVTTDQVYNYNYTYGSFGLLDVVTYPTSPTPAGETGPRLKVQYQYSSNSGQLYRIRDVTQSGAAIVLWQVTATNSYSSPTAESLSAGTIAVTSGYKAWTNELTSATAGVAGSTTNRQNLVYDWDTVGKLNSRQDVTLGLTETFQYDNLDRIDKAFRNGVEKLNVDYDLTGNGNISSKSDVGAYTYGDANHPHAVTAAGANYTFAYDANGNAKTRNGLTQTWTAFDLPSNLQATVGVATYSSQFQYGPDHQRWRQVATYSNGTETTHYVGGLLEKVSSNGDTMWRHYIPTPGGTAIVISRNADLSKSVTYVLSDHLTSSDVLLDNNGNYVTRLSFDSFGARRGTDWLATTPPDWVGIAETSRRGYTSHEMLDNIGMIHMNGRVYDSVVGRFLSVDPLIGSMADSQSLNAFAYVGNRPLNSTDPMGLDAVGGCPGCGYIGIAIEIFERFGFFRHNLPPPPASASPGTSSQTGINVCDAGMSSPSCGAIGALGIGPMPSLETILGASPGAPDGPCAECNHGNVGDFIWGLFTGAVDSTTSGVVFIVIVGVGASTGNPFIVQAADDVSSKAIVFGRPDSNLGEFGYDLGPLVPVSGGSGAVVRGVRVISRGSVVFGKQAAREISAAARAKEIHAVLNPRTQQKVTTAVLDTREGVRVVASSEGRLRPAQRAAMKPGEIAAEGQRGVHAEINAINAAREKGLTPIGVSPSRPACPMCAQAMDDAGVPITNP